MRKLRSLSLMISHLNVCCLGKVIGELPRS